MATYERADRSASRTAAALGRSVLVGVIAGVETAVLGVWLLLVGDAPVVSLATAAGFAVLAGGLVVKFVVSDVAVNGRDATFPGPRAMTVVTGETGLWALWLLIASRVGGIDGIAVAGGVFALLLVAQHTVEDNALRGRPLVETLADFDAVGFSLVQAGGATLWLLFTVRGEVLGPLLADADALVGSHLPVDVASLDPGLVGLAVLAAALFVEHFVGVSFSRHGDQSRTASSSERR